MNKTVLIVDDFASTRKVIGASLEKIGINVLNAENGKEAKLMFDGRKIDLLITDLNMPFMSGVELTEYVRNTNTYNKIPILLLTTEVSKTKKDDALAAGVTAIMNKPYNSADFTLVVKKLLSI